MQQSQKKPLAVLEVALMSDHNLLKGAAEIAVFLFGDARHRRIVYYLVERKQLPIVRLGCRIYARKSTLLRWFRSRESTVVGAIDLPDSFSTVVVQEDTDNSQFIVLWKDSDGFVRQRGSFSSGADAEAYAAQLRCRLEIDAYQSELKNVRSS